MRVNVKLRFKPDLLFGRNGSDLMVDTGRLYYTGNCYLSSLVSPCVHENVCVKKCEKGNLKGKKISV